MPAIVDSTALDRRLAEYDAQIALIRGELDVIAQLYRVVTADWLAGWYEDETKRAITADPDKTAATPDGAFGEMREEVVELVGRVPAIVDEQLGDDCWPHRGDDEAIAAEDREMTRLPPLVDLGNRRAMGLLGRILSQHGFGRAVDVAVAGGISAYDWIIDGDVVEYPYAVTLSDQAKAVFVDYARSWVLLHATVCEKVELAAERRRAEMLDRWDSL
jgi:hypothetical protein